MDTPEPWTRAELLGQFRAVAEAGYHDRHPFNQAMHQGLLSPEQLRAWIENRYYYQRQIPVKDALILARLPGREERRVWVRRILYHDGTRGDEGGLEAWLQLGEAAGIPRRRLEAGAGVLPAARDAVDSYVDFCRARPWPEAVASSLTELFAPALMASRVAAIERHYPWLDPTGLRYFRDRVDAAPREAQQALELVARASTTREAQERAVAALEFKCGVLWALLDAVERTGSC
ncbi:MAG: pyrroloquinoline-quinone synthase PqqC [Chloroflexi bacterium]|nr:MAG: pyrroloquinoline-quinone synthase PqqC [Chloroflexota bacterium]